MGNRYVIPAGISRTVRDVSGNILAGAVIQIYLAGTTTLVTFYDTFAGVVPTGSVATDANGKFLAFVDDDDYPLTQNFKFVTTYGGQSVIDDYVR
jgi:hypothetical protein